MDSEEIERWDEESERAWREDKHDVEFSESIAILLGSILPKNAKILDAGCGIGKHLKAFRTLGYRNLYGIDQSKKAIEYAKILNPDIILENARIQDLHGKNFFDLIHTCAVLQHSTHERKGKILQKFREVLKKDSYLLSAECTFTPETLKVLKEEVLKVPYLGWSEEWSDGYSFSEKGWIKFMAENHFKHLKTIPPWSYYLWQVQK